MNKNEKNMRLRNGLLSASLALLFVALIASSNNPMIFAILPEGGGGGGGNPYRLIASETRQGYMTKRDGTQLNAYVTYTWDVYDQLGGKSKVVTTIKIENRGVHDDDDDYYQLFDYIPYHDGSSGEFSFSGFKIIQGGEFITFYGMDYDRYKVKIGSTFNNGDTVKVRITWLSNGEMPSTTYHFYAYAIANLPQEYFVFRSFWDPYLPL